MISSYPYITFYTLLCSLANRAYLEDWDTPSAVRYCSLLNKTKLPDSGNTLFCFSTPEKLPTCLEEIAKTKRQWYLVIGRSDTALTSHHQKYILDKSFIVGIASQNCFPIDPRVINIPIGIENYGWGLSDLAPTEPPPQNNPYILRDFAELSRSIHQSRQKHPRLLVSFSLGTNLECRKEFFYWSMHNEQARIMMPRQRHINIANQAIYFEYLHECIEAGYVLCPPGNGFDTHRFWQTLYLGLVPVCHSKYILPCYNVIHACGYKFITVSDERELSTLELPSSSDDLDHPFLSTPSCSNTPHLSSPLHVQYWIDTINYHNLTLSNSLP